MKETSIPSIGRELKTEFGRMKVSPIVRNRVDYRMGNPNPRNGVYPVPQREILEDIMNSLGGAVNIVGDMPDVVIDSRGVVEKIPRKIEELPAFQGSEYVFYHQKAYGNFYRMARRALRIRFANPYYFIKADLMERHILKTGREPVLKKLRSILKTEWVITDAQGYLNLGPSNIMRLERELIRRRWWTDIGEPTPFQVPVNSGIRGQIYRLQRRNCIIIV